MMQITAGVLRLPLGTFLVGSALAGGGINADLFQDVVPDP